MKIYSNILTKQDVENAFFVARTDHQADIHIEAIREWKPRAYANGVEVWGESLHGKRATGRGRDASARGRAASWDDWGTVIALLYNADPHARISFYDNEADFVAKVRRYKPKDATLKFLELLANIGEYDEA